MLKSRIDYDKAEFVNAVIGWLGYDKLYMEVLKCDRNTLNEYLADESERFEDDLAQALMNMSVEDLNDLSKRHKLNSFVFEG